MGVQPVKPIIEWEFQPPEPVGNRCVGTICPLSRGPIFLDGNCSGNVLSTVSPPPGSIQTKDVYKIIRQKGAKKIWSKRLVIMSAHSRFEIPGVQVFSTAPRQSFRAITTMEGTRISLRPRFSRVLTTKSGNPPLLTASRWAMLWAVISSCWSPGDIDLILLSSSPSGALFRMCWVGLLEVACEVLLTSLEDLALSELRFLCA